MDFFTSQDNARRNTKLFVFYFAAGVVLLVAAVYVAVWFVFRGLNRPMWDPRLFAGAAAGTLAVVGCGSAYKTIQLRQGGSAVATSLGGRLVQPNTRNADERRLLNVVEEMAIASGIPVPQVYVLPQERGINAFAAGHSPSDAVVAVTQGTLKLLTRDELQGVIGHEFSHILNGDMRLNLRLMGLIFGILCLAIIGRVLLRTRGRKNPLPVLGLALVLIGMVGVLFGRLIQAAVSRQREFLADAAAVQFTRNPGGLASALKKIGGLAQGSKLETANAVEASHLFFANGVSSFFSGLMATHPQLDERILALEPGFDGVFPRTALPPSEEPAPPVIARKVERRTYTVPFTPRGAQAGVTSEAVALALAPAAALTQVGQPIERHLRYAEELRDAIPQVLLEAAREPMGASTLVYALLLSTEATTRSKQLELLQQHTSAAVVQETLRVLPQVWTVAERARLPLVEMGVAGLRRLSPPQFEQFRTATRALVDADAEIDLFEYMLQKLVLRHLEPHFLPARKPVVQYYALRPLAADCAVLLSSLAQVGNDEPAAISSAFARGADRIAVAAQTEITLLPPERCGLADIDAALNRLATAAPQIKKNALDACAETVAADGVIRETEAEMLRAIADSLDCPMPPFGPVPLEITNAPG